MARMGTASASARTIGAALLALLLGVRLLAPAGFMPAFDRGAVTIVACPDADGTIVLAHHRHPANHNGQHQHCPYAAATSLGAAAGQAAPLVALLLFAAVPLLGRSLQFAERRRANERPHPTGPPIPA